MEKTNISTYVFRSDEIINIVLFGIGVTREDVSTYIEWKDTSNLPPRKITNKSKPRKSG